MKKVLSSLLLAGASSMLILSGEFLSHHAPDLPVWLAFGCNAVLVFVLALAYHRRTEQARRQTALAGFSREMADSLARQTQPSGVLEHSAVLLSRFLGVSVAVMAPDPAGAGPYTTVTAVRVGPAFEPVPEAVQWSARNARPVGPGTDNWPTFPVWYVPFSRLPGDRPVLLVAVSPALNAADTLSFLRSFADQVAAVWEGLISLQRASEAEISAERQRLQNSFLASISHDMRTPLTAILGTSSTLIEQHDQLSAQQQQHLLRSLHNEVGYLASATDNVLSLVRLNQSGRTDISTDWESPEELLGLVLSRFSDASRQGRLRADAQPVSLLIRANAMLVVQALVNLVDNALKVHQSPEPVCLGLSASGGEVSFAVADRGPGFPPDFDLRRHREFPRYDSGSRGVGLGLSIVQAIARVHEGGVEFNNRPGGGTEVVLRLPASPWEASAHG